MTTLCPSHECIHNDRLDPARCKLAENELNERGNCISFVADNQYLKQEFKERRRAHIRNLEKAHQYNKNKKEPPTPEKAENLHGSARKFLLGETEE